MNRTRTFKYAAIAFALAMLAHACAFADAVIVHVKLLDIERHYESHWRDAYAEKLAQTCKHVETEKKVRGGRADIVTETYAIEIDRAKKWHEAIGQAVHYANELKKKPQIALFNYNALNKAQRKALESVAKKRRITIVALTAE